MDSHIIGKCYNSSGDLQIEIFGSWHDKICIKDVQTGETEVLWEMPNLIQNAHMNYYFDHFAILMNYKNEKMAKIICPTDSRFRGDTTYFE